MNLYITGDFINEEVINKVINVKENNIFYDNTIVGNYIQSIRNGNNYTNLNKIFHESWKEVINIGIKDADKVIILWRNISNFAEYAILQSLFLNKSGTIYTLKDNKINKMILFPIKRM